MGVCWLLNVPARLRTVCSSYCNQERGVLCDKDEKIVRVWEEKKRRIFRNLRQQKEDNCLGGREVWFPLLSMTKKESLCS